MDNSRKSISIALEVAKRNRTKVTGAKPVSKDEQPRSNPKMDAKELAQAVRAKMSKGGMPEDQEDDLPHTDDLDDILDTTELDVDSEEAEDPKEKQRSRIAEAVKRSIYK